MKYKPQFLLIIKFLFLKRSMTYFDSFRTKFFDKIDKKFENEEIKIEKQEIFFVKFAFFDFFLSKTTFGNIID